MTQHPPPPPSWQNDVLTVGITGTNGKTTTTRFVAAVLSLLGAPAPSVTTVGFYLGNEELPLSGSYASFLRTLRLGYERGARHAAIELSSEALARGFFRAWPCQMGVFTNLTWDHLDSHGNSEHYLASKAQLFHLLPADGVAILNGHDAAGLFMAEVAPPTVRKLFYGIESRGPALTSVDFAASDIGWNWEGTRATVRTPAGQVTLRTQAIGPIFMENALAALCVAYALEVPMSLALDAIAAAPPPKGRFEAFGTGPRAIIDYAHTPDAMRRTLLAARDLCKGRLSVVFGAGGNRDREKRAMMGQAASIADRIVITADNPRDERSEDIAEQIREGVPPSVQTVTLLDRAEAITEAIVGAHYEDVIVVAGKGHETTQTIDGNVREFSDHHIVVSALSRRA